MAHKNGIWIDKNTFIQFSDKTTKPLSEEIATRSRSIDFYSLGMYLPNPDPVLKKMGKDIAVYNELMSDGHLGGCVTSREAGVKSLEWMIDRGKSPARTASIIEDVFDNMDIDNILSEMLKAPLFGYSPLEILWERVGGYILPKDLVGKPHEWFVFDEDNQLRFRTKTNYNGEELPPRKFLLARHKPTYQNPYGFAELSRCFWPVTFKRGGFKFWVKFAEKYGMPFLWGKLPRGLDQKEYDSLADSLENMVQDAIAVTPDDASIEMLTIEGRATGDIYSKLIGECKSEVSIALLGQNLTTEVKGGSFAATQAHMEVRKDITESDKKVCERVFNELIGHICDLNFASGARPVFEMYEQEDVDKTLAERDQLLSQTGVKFTEKYFIKAYGLEEEDFEITDIPPQSPFGNPFKSNAPQPPLNPRGGGADLSPTSAFASFAEGDWTDLYMQRVEPLLKGARQSAMEDIRKWIDSLDEPPSEEIFMDKIKGILGTAYKALDQAAIADVVSEIYTFYKMTDLLTGIEAKFGGADARSIDFLAKLDQFYLSKYIENPDTIKIVGEFLKEKYLEGGTGLFGNTDPQAIQEFLDTLSQKMIDLEDWQARRIIDTAVQRTRNWGHISQVNDAGIAKVQVYEPTHDCDFCTAMNGRVIDVPTAYQQMRDLSSMSPDAYEAFLKEPRNAATLVNIDSIAGRGLLPPYHPHCTGRIIILT